VSGRLEGRFGAAALAALAATWKVEILGRPAEELRRGQRPVVWALWHGHLLPLLWLHRHQGIALLISRHRDGERLAGVATALGYRVIRGSSTRGGSAALLRLVRALRQGQPVALAADGPAGPRERAKPGAVAASRLTGVPIVPVALAARPAVRLGSWDRFVLPPPWARVRVAYGDPWPAPASREADLGEATLQLSERLLALCQMADLA
jgi:hypothetical protein